MERNSLNSYTYSESSQPFSYGRTKKKVTEYFSIINGYHFCSTLHVSSYLIPQNSPMGLHLSLLSPFYVGEIKNQKDQFIQPRSHNQQFAELISKPRKSSYKTIPPHLSREAKIRQAHITPLWCPSAILTALSTCVIAQAPPCMRNSLTPHHTLDSISPSTEFPHLLSIYTM